MKNIFNKQLIIILAVFLALLIGLALGIAKPRFQTLKKRYKNLSENQTKLASLIARKESLIKLKKDEKRIESALKKAQNILPDQKQTSDFLVQLEAGSSETGNALDLIEMTEEPKKKEEKKGEEEKEKTPYQTIVFSITLSGNFKQLSDFLVLSESLSRFVSFPSLSITGKENNLIETTLEGEIYYK